MDSNDDLLKKLLLLENKFILYHFTFLSTTSFQNRKLLKTIINEVRIKNTFIHYSTMNAIETHSVYIYNNPDKYNFGFVKFFYLWVVNK